jgi:hypothetical protein
MLREVTKESRKGTKISLTGPRNTAITGTEHRGHQVADLREMTCLF